MRRPLSLCSLAGIALALLALGCQRDEAPGGPPEAPIERGDARPEPLSAVLITLDTTRADVIGAYGAPAGLTPELDALAGESVVYDAAYTVAPTTHASHASMLTGLTPLRHGIRDNGMRALTPAAVTVAELARAAGLETTAVIAATVLGRSSGLDQGFGDFDVPRRPATRLTASAPQRRATQISAAVLRWLEGRGDGRFFLWVHFFDPHAPYDPPRPYSERGTPYQGEVAFTSSQVGRIVAALRASGALEETLVIVVGDHGESFGEHGEETHGMLCYQPTMRVPFWIRYPDGYREGERSEELVSVADVMPTLADAMGLEVPEGLDGRSLYRRRMPADRGLYLESYTAHVAYRWSPIAGWVDRAGKYLHSSEPEFYDLADDPEERTNLVAERVQDVERHRAAIAEVARRPRLAESDAGIDEATLAELRLLGYLAAGDAPAALPGPLEATPLPSPRRMMGVHRQAQKGLAALSAGRPADARVVFEAVLRKDPGNRFARTQLGLSMMRSGSCDEAVEVLGSLVREGLERAAVYYNLGTCQRDLGRPAAAIEQLERAVELDPAEPIFLRDLVELLEEHRPDEAPAYAARLRALTEAP